MMRSIKTRKRIRWAIASIFACLVALHFLRVLVRINDERLLVIDDGMVTLMSGADGIAEFVMINFPEEAFTPRLMIPDLSELRLPRWERMGGASVLVIPFWTPLLATLIAGIIAFRKPRPASICTCGYDLTANTTGACPECGREIDAPSGRR